MQRYTVYLYLETAPHVSGGTSTHHQERIQLYLQHLVFVTPFLLSAAIVEELELVRVCCGWRTPPTAHSGICHSIQTCTLDGHLHRVTYTRCRIDTINSPDDERKGAGNM